MDSRIRTVFYFYLALFENSKKSHFIKNYTIFVPSFCPCPDPISIPVFKGEVNFLWILVLIAIICNVIADVSYGIAIAGDSYYPGHPMDILYIWAYIFVAFGVYSHIRLFNIEQNKLQTFD
jgi:hypothetical protein